MRIFRILVPKDFPSLLMSSFVWACWETNHCWNIWCSGSLFPKSKAPGPLHMQRSRLRMQLLQFLVCYSELDNNINPIWFTKRDMIPDMKTQRLRAPMCEAICCFFSIDATYEQLIIILRVCMQASYGARLNITYKQYYGRLWVFNTSMNIESLWTYKMTYCI